MRPVDQEHIDQLCEELRPLLNAELAAGNSVIETHKGWPAPDGVSLLLARPFTVDADSLPAGVRLVEVNDPHYWKSEVVCDRLQHRLLFPFG